MSAATKFVDNVDEVHRRCIEQGLDGSIPARTGGMGEVYRAYDTSLKRDSPASEIGLIEKSTFGV